MPKNLNNKGKKATSVLIGKKLPYDHQRVEKHWQEVWAKEKTYSPDIENAKNPYYNLWMFPYPSAEGLHVGHAFTSTGGDVHGRFMRMQGKDVFQPTGYDSFGIHSENYALKIGVNPKDLMEKTTKRYEVQLKSLGQGYDWHRTVTTSDIDFYRWTEWLFVQLFKAGLAFKKKAVVNFCPKDKTVLADEQVMTPKQAAKDPVDASGNPVPMSEDLRVCERCGTVAEKRELEQWFFRITDYADRLLGGLNKIDWTEKVKVAQKEWIGKSKGLTINFSIDVSKANHEKQTINNIPVWTKFWETVYGVTFLVVSPEYAKEKLMGFVEESYAKEVNKYIEISLSKSEQDRKSGKEKSGVSTGIYATNPVNRDKVPVFVADYVLANVGTGAVMGVPAHDERDFEFAKKNTLKVIQVVLYEDAKINEKVGRGEIPYEGQGQITNSGKFDGLSAWGEGKEKMAEWMIKEGFARWEVNYHLRDWLISRQRYWGCPIPMIYCSNCASERKGWLVENPALLHQDQSDWASVGWYPVPDEDLPVELPYIKDWKPEGTGKGPLANHPDFFETKCPACDSKATRETDVADTFLDSSWYFLRYPSADAKSSTNLPFDADVTGKWLPVNLYFGGAEHAVLHLMYARFVNMVMHDLKYLNFEEPFPKFFANGLMIKDGAKMSKSRGNVVNPDEYVEKFGADTLRLYLMFMGPIEGYPDFRDSGIEGMQKFVNRLWNVFQVLNKNEKEDQELTIKMHQTIKKVTSQIQHFKYNTAIAAIMEFVNALESKLKSSRAQSRDPQKASIGLRKEYLECLVKLIAPFAPHLSEEVWQKYFSAGYFSSIHHAKWPEFDESLVEEKYLTIILQINGKLRSQLVVVANEAGNREKLISDASKDPKIQKWIEGKNVKNTVFVPQKLINFVV